MKLIAISTLFHKGKTVEPGGVVTLSKTDGQILIDNGQAKLAPENTSAKGKAKAAPAKRTAKTKQTPDTANDAPVS